MTPINNTSQQMLTQWLDQSTYYVVPCIYGPSNLSGSYKFPYYKVEQQSEGLQNQTNFAPCYIRYPPVADNRYLSLRLPPISSLTAPISTSNYEVRDCYSFPIQRSHIEPSTLAQLPQKISVDRHFEYSAGGDSLEQQPYDDIIYLNPQASASPEIQGQNAHHTVRNLAPDTSVSTPEKKARVMIAQSYKKKRKEALKNGLEPAIILHKRCSYCGKLFAQSSSSKADHSVPASHSSCKCLQSNNKMICKLSKDSIKRR